MNIREIKKEYIGQIDLLDLDLIIAHAIKKTREFILAHLDFEINKVQKIKIDQFVQRRINHEPLAYILGHKEFFGLDFKVNKNTLIPRPETELIVEKVIEKTKNNKLPISIIDIGTGSGNIITTLAKNLKNENINYFAVDISKKALKIAKENAKQHKVNNHPASEIKFIQSNLLNFLLRKKFKINANLIITANLPYLDNNWKNLCTDIRGLKYEPRLAWHGGKDGLDLYRNLYKQLLLLKEQNKIDRTYLLCEIGPEQKSSLEKTIQKIFPNKVTVNFYRDLAYKWRICEINL